MPLPLIEALFMAKIEFCPNGLGYVVYASAFELVEERTKRVSVAYLLRYTKQLR